MINLYTEIAKYLIVILTALYTFCNFRYFAVREAQTKREYCAWQRKMLLLLHLVAFSVLFFRTGELRYLGLYGVQLLFLLTYPFLMRHLYRNHSELLLNNMSFFLMIGMVMLARLSFSESVRQFLIVAASALLTLMIPYVMDRVLGLTRWCWLYMILGLGLLLLVFVTGAVSYGAKMALRIGGVSFQPSEFVKITFVFFAASMLFRSLNFKNLCVTSGIAALHVLILVACRDLGTALLFFLSYVVMLYIATGRSIYLFIGSGMFAAAGAAAYRLFSHFRVRVSVWLDPWKDISGSGYQIAHSLFAIGTGGLFGAGLFCGMPERIPIVEKDFVFSAISEEMGAITALCLILLCLGCFLQMMLTALYMDMLFYKLIAAGLSVIYITQVFLTVGGAIKFIPSTGVTLPFVSYGGSSILSSFALFMVVQGLHLIMMNEADEEESMELSYGEDEDDFREDDFSEDAEEDFSE